MQYTYIILEKFLMKHINELRGIHFARVNYRITYSRDRPK